MVTTRTRPWPTYQDYLDIPGEDRYELINGEFILVSAPDIAHPRRLLGQPGQDFSLILEK